MNKKSYLWNSIASMLYAGMSAILMLAVIRILGVEEGGLFSLGYSIAQLMLTIGNFDMRAYQATDVANKYRFEDYLSSRLVTGLFMIGGSIVYIFIKGYTGDKFLIIFILCIFKLSDAIEDVYHGQLQRTDHLDVAGFIQTLRLLICVILFVGVMLIFKSLLISGIVTTLVALLLAIIPNVIVLNRYEQYSFSFMPKNVFGLLWTSFPLFIGSYLSLYIGNAPKYAIDSYIGDVAQSIYGIIFMPSYVINLLSGFILRPALTSLADDWEKGLLKKEAVRLLKLMAVILGMTILVSGLAFLWGTQVLGFVYGVDIGDYRAELLILLIGGGFYAFGIVMYYAVTIARKQKYLTVVYALVAVATYFTSILLVKRSGIMGASLVYLLSTVFRFLGFLIIYLIIVLRKQKGHDI